MTVPRHEDKLRAEPVVTPAESVAYAEGDQPTPETVLLCFSRTLFEYLEDAYPATPIEGARSACGFDLPETSLGAFLVPGVGAPMATLVVEELIARGTERFCIVGHAGGLDPAFDIGDVVVIDRALRDEGTSHHYLDGGPYAEADPDLTGWLGETLERAGVGYEVGPTWTTDAVYRETVAEVRAYREAGIRTVDMEAASVFTVARYRDAEAGAVFAISDILEPDAWTPGFSRTQPHLETVADAVIEGLRRHPPEGAVT